MPDPTRRAAAERAREAEREVARHTKVLRERAAAAAALIERDGAIGRSRLRAGVGKRVGGETRLASAGQPGSMPAPRRLAREFGSGNDDASATPLSHSDVCPVRDGSGSRTRHAPETRACLVGRWARRRRARRGLARAARRIFGDEKNAFPLPGGLETPAVARTRAAATPVAARGVNARVGPRGCRTATGWRPPRWRGRASRRRPSRRAALTLETGSPSAERRRASRGRHDDDLWHGHQTIYAGRTPPRRRERNKKNKKNK